MTALGVFIMLMDMTMLICFGIGRIDLVFAAAVIASAAAEESSGKLSSKFIDC